MSKADQSVRLPDWDALAAQAAGPSAEPLAALAQADQRARWQESNRLPAEIYLEHLPGLRDDLEGQLDFIYGEVVLREELGECPQLQEYLNRFPQHAEALRRQFALHQAVHSGLPSRFSDRETSEPGMPPFVSPLSSQSRETPSVADHHETPPVQPKDRQPKSLPERFGRYQIRRLLGRGGMGAVYLAYDTELEREVALKVPRFAEESSPAARERFLREARAAAALAHPNICPVYDVGTLDGIPYLTMAYVEGQALSDRLRGGSLPVNESVGLVRQLALALDEAHRHGVVHRDLKPANIMLNAREEPIIMDFGLARLMRAGEARLTVDGQMIGTPAYMSPEQVNGDSLAMGPPCDVYSLGAIFYELLTGRPPFEGPVSKVLAQVLTDDPVAPSERRAGVPAELSAICRKAMAKKATDRYSSMADFARALEVYTMRNSGDATPLPSTVTHDCQPRQAGNARKGRREVVLVGLLLLFGLVGAGVAGYARYFAGGPREEQQSTQVAIAAPALLKPPLTADPLRLAQQAKKILETNCYRCHGQDGSKEGGFASVLNVQRMIKSRKIVAGKAADSKIIKKIRGGEMPPEEETTRPSKEDLAVLGAWIDAGAPPFPAQGPSSRRFCGTKETLTALRDHLCKVPRDDRRYQRYFTLTILHNNPKATEADLCLARAAVAKLVNSLSWKNSIVVPQVIDADQTILAVDLRQLDWDRPNYWNGLLKVYPYGLKHDKSGDDEIRELAREVYEKSGCELPFIRADWFVAVASRPPLYHTLLHIPHCAGDLERTLKVDVYDNFRRDRLARAGFASSGISGQNRLVERHESVYGVYWKSYDFRSNEGLSNLFRYPLGPEFNDHPYPLQTFKHDGGEIIFSLPNGLSGYMLVNGKEERIDEGPIDVVSDALKTSGTAKIVNGLSCIACHAQGMQSNFKDTVRDGTPLQGVPLDKCRRLYPKADVMDRLLQGDSDRFLAALKKATGPFLCVGENKEKDIKDFPEPCGILARQHILKELTAEDAARELGLADVQILVTAIKNNERLRQIGLGPLATGAAIKREAWSETKNRLTSPYQEAASALELGTPYLVIK